MGAAEICVCPAKVSGRFQRISGRVAHAKDLRPEAKADGERIVCVCKPLGWAGKSILEETGRASGPLGRRPPIRAKGSC